MSQKLAEQLASKTKPLSDAEATDLLAKRFPDGARENASSDVTALDEVGQNGLFFADCKSDGCPSSLQTLADAVKQGRSEGFVAVNPHADPDLHKRMQAMVAAKGRPDEFFVLNHDSSAPQ